jgi:hypothetical protein
MASNATPGPRVVAWAGLLALLATLLAQVWFSPDIWYHLFLGQRIWETGTIQPPDLRILEQRGFANGYWLFQLLCLGIWELGGIWGLSLLFAALWLGIALLWVRLAAVAAFPVAGLPAALGALLVVRLRFEPRPEVFSFLFAMVTLHALARWDLRRGPGWKRILLLACVQALWANMHGYFALGPVLIGLRCAAALCARDRAAARGSALLLAAAALASLATPLGLGHVAFVATYARVLDQLGGSVQEFRAPLGPFLQRWDVQLFWVLWALTGAGALAAVFARGRPAAFAAATAALGLLLGARSLRNVPLAILFAAPLLGEALEAAGRAGGGVGRPRWLEALRTGPAAGRASAFATAAAALALAGWAIEGGYYRALRSEASFGVRLSTAAYPVHFAEYLRKSGFAGRLFNVSSDGGYLEFFAPAIRVYGDSLFTDPAAVEGYFAAASQPEAFFALDARHAFDGVLLKIVGHGSLALALLSKPGFELAYADLHRIFFARAKRGAGGAPLPEEIRFYRGEDLTSPVHGLAAIEWTRLWIAAGRRDLLLRALRDFAAAPRIPSFVLEFGLDFAIRSRDAEVAALLVELRPKLFALSRRDERSVDELVRSLRPGGLEPRAGAPQVKSEPGAPGAPRPRGGSSPPPARRRRGRPGASPARARTSRRRGSPRPRRPWPRRAPRRRWAPRRSA